VACLPALLLLLDWLALGNGVERGAVLAGLLVGGLVGLTGMGSGALMTPVLILAAGSLLIGAVVRGRAGRGAGTGDTTPVPARRAVALGAVVGFLVGLTSVGSGSLVVAALTLGTPLGAATIVGTDIAHAALLTTAAGLAHGAAGNIDLRLMLSLLAGSLPGVLLGSRVSVRAPALALRLTLTGVLFLTAFALI
jgi:uncharacterized membrane protein YfcA